MGTKLSLDLLRWRLHGNLKYHWYTSQLLPWCEIRLWNGPKSPDFFCQGIPGSAKERRGWLGSWGMLFQLSRNGTSEWEYCHILEHVNTNDDNHDHQDDHHPVMNCQLKIININIIIVLVVVLLLLLIIIIILILILIIIIIIIFNINNDNNNRRRPSCRQQLFTHDWRLWTACAPKVAEHSSWSSSAVMGSGRPSNNWRQGRETGTRCYVYEMLKSLQWYLI